jgi:hypothetical protein
VENGLDVFQPDVDTPDFGGSTRVRRGFAKSGF